VQMHSYPGYPSEIAERLRDRRLFKRATYVGFDAVGKGVLKHRNKIRRIEAELASDLGIDPEYILIDIPKPPDIVETGANIMVDQQLRRLHEISHLVAAIGNAQQDNWRLGVYTPAEYRDAVRRAANGFFGVKKHKQFRLDELIT
jgi:HD superfamily phosphohydrolase